MSTISHIPNPALVSIVSAGYTIPASRYARAVVNLEGSATFTIGGVTALRGTQNSVLGSDNLTRITASGTGSGVVGSLGTDGGSTGNNGYSGVGGAFTEAIDQKTVVQDYFLPAGSVINGTGTWRAVVEEYFG